MFVFLAFYFGVKLSRWILFTLHDLKIMKQNSFNRKTTKLFTLIIKIVIVIELFFLISWAILYKYLSISIRSSLGIEVNVLIIILWIFGFLYGLILSTIQSIFIKNLLLKNEMGIVLFISGEVIKDNLKKKSIFKF